MDPTEEAGTERSRALTSAISDLLVRAMSEFTGRGPTRARTYLNHDLVTVVLRDTLTRGERSLVADGRADHVRQTRRMYQQTMRTTVIEGIEELTGRRVHAFLSDNHIDPDIAVEVFVMEPGAVSEDNGQFD